jgi:hypothetical protein
MRDDAEIGIRVRGLEEEWPQAQVKVEQVTEEVIEIAGVFDVV